MPTRLSPLGLTLCSLSSRPLPLSPPPLSPPQIYFQYKYFLPDPIANDVKYQASAQPFLVFGLLTAGLACGHHVNAVAAAASAAGAL